MNNVYRNAENYANRVLEMYGFARFLFDEVERKGKLARANTSQFSAAKWVKYRLEINAAGFIQFVYRSTQFSRAQSIVVAGTRITSDLDISREISIINGQTHIKVNEREIELRGEYSEEWDFQLSLVLSPNELKRYYVLSILVHVGFVGRIMLGHDLLTYTNTLKGVIAEAKKQRYKIPERYMEED